MNRSTLYTIWTSLPLQSLSSMIWWECPKTAWKVSEHFISGNMSTAIKFVLMLWVLNFSTSTFAVWEITRRVTQTFWWKTLKFSSSTSLSKQNKSMTACLFFSEKKAWANPPVSTKIQLQAVFDQIDTLLPLLNQKVTSDCHLSKHFGQLIVYVKNK